MASVVDSMPGRTQWDKYLDGQIWELKSPDDFKPGEAKHIRTKIANFTDRHGINILIAQRSGKVYVQAVKT